MVEMVSNFLMIDDNFLDLLKIDLIAGNNFSNKNVQGDNNGIIINERMVKTMGLKKPEDAIGKRINFMFNGKVIGVVKDFNYESLNFDLEPLVLVNSFGEEVLGTFMIKTKNVKSVKKIWLDYFPDNRFEYQSYTDFYNNLYKKDQKNMKLIIYLTLITILLSCSGLFAMSAYTFQIKLKEFGIRKIFGADKGNLALAFLRTFSVPILVSLIIAIPLSFEIANRWLQTYSFRIELTIWLFVISLIISVIIFGVVISYYIIKTFKMNPIDTIREQ
jgi:putative ABC transport system permease protein